MRTTGAVLFVSLGLTAAARAGEFRPDFGKAVLVRGGEKVAPLEVGESPPAGVDAGGLRIQVEESTVRALRPSTGKVVWSRTIEDGQRAAIVALGDDFVGLEYRARTEGDVWRPAGRGTLHRWKLSDGKELPALRVPDGKEGEEIAAVEIGEDGIFVLSVFGGDRSSPWEDPDHYRVTRFADHAVAWSRAYDSAGRTGGPHAMLLGGGGPAWAGPGTRPLSLIRGDLVVCAGGGEDIVAIDREDGGERWRLPAIWEFERSFVGPSVWSYFLSRGTGIWGDEDESDDEKQAKRAKLRKLRRIVAGPIAVPWQGTDGFFGNETRDGYRLFVAVAYDVNEEEGGYLSHAWVYEVNDVGRPVAVLPMPRMVRGGFRRGEEAVWVCAGGGIGATAPSFQRESHGMGGGGTDHVGRLAWYRQPASFEPPETAWLRTGRNGEYRVIDGDRMFLVPAGAWLVSKEEKVFRFPVRRLDLATGAEEDLVVEVPFTGEVPPPTGGSYSCSRDADGTERWTTGGPYFLAITGLSAEPDRIAVDLATTSGEAAHLVFPDPSKR